MKKRFVLSFLVIIIAQNLWAQNYQSFRSDRTYLYNNYLTQSIRFDSVQVSEQDSVLYAFKNIPANYYLVDFRCYSLHAFIGDSVLIKNNGENIFFNQQGDSIVIRTNAHLNETWNFFSDTIYTVNATVSNIDTMHFGSIIDSVKTIQLNVFDSTGSSITLNLYSNEIKLSKNFGLINFPTFLAYPHEELNVDFHNEYNLKLIGINTSNFGIQNINTFEIYDFAVGDEIHTTTKRVEYDYIKEKTYVTYTQIIDKYLNRLDKTDTIVYTVEQEKGIKHYNYNDDTVTYRYTKDTLTKTIIANEYIDRLPGSIRIDEYNLECYIATLTQTSKSIYEMFWLNRIEEDCWYPEIVDFLGESTPDTYLKGLGGPFYAYSTFFIPDNYEVKLVYYHKEEKEWGTPLIISTEKHSVAQHSNLNVVYNKASKQVNFNTHESTGLVKTISLYSLNGSMVHQTKFKMPNIVIDLSSFKEGIYFYELKDQQHQTRGKLLVN